MKRQILEGDALCRLGDIDNNTIDLMCTDPPYGYSFMHKDWDKSIISIDIWRECLRVLKPGAFAFVMSAPRQDVLSHMIVNLTDAGFKTDFTSIYWTYATGFPKAANISKMVDKKGGRINIKNKELKIELNKLREKKGLSRNKVSVLCGFEARNYFRIDNHLETVFPSTDKWNKIKKVLECGNKLDDLFKEAKREIIGKGKANCYSENKVFELDNKEYGDYDITIPKTDQAKKLDGSYAGFQPKPAVEVILVCMKPLSEKNYTEQAMKNGKGVTWFNDCRIPYSDDNDKKSAIPQGKLTNDKWLLDEKKQGRHEWINKEDYPLKGRFPANLIVSDDTLNDGHNYKVGNSKKITQGEGSDFGGGSHTPINHYGDSGSFSRYFSLDAWEAQFIITPKSSKSEKNKGLDKHLTNTHPTVKPISLLKYLITLGSRENDIVLDPFMGSGTTAIAAEQIARDWIGIEKIPEYIKIFKARLVDYKKQQKMEVFS